MTTRSSLESVAQNLVADGKGILAADETVPTLTKRFDTLGIKSTEHSRRTYREMLFTAPDAAEFISGAIMYDETIRQKNSGGTPLANTLAGQGILPGIKVDTDAKPFAGSPKETVTEGLDGLRDRLKEYRDLGAHFAKWRAVIHVTDTLPSAACVNANAHALARYASLCQEQELVPIVEPEVLMDGSHSVKRCEEVTGVVLHAVFDALFDQGVALEGMLLKPNMVIAGKECAQQAFGGAGRRRDVTQLAPPRAGGGARDRLPVGQATRALSDRPFQRNKPVTSHETLEDQLLLRAHASGSRARRMAWTRRAFGGWPAGLLPPSSLKRSGDTRQHRRDGGRIGKRRPHAAANGTTTD